MLYEDFSGNDRMYNLREVVVSKFFIEIVGMNIGRPLYIRIDMVEVTLR